MSKLPNGIANVAMKLTEAVGDLTTGKGRIKTRLQGAFTRRLSTFDASAFPEDEGVVFEKIKQKVGEIEELSEDEAVYVAGLLEDLNSKIHWLLDEAA